MLIKSISVFDKNFGNFIQSLIFQVFLVYKKGVEGILKTIIFNNSYTVIRNNGSWTKHS